MNKKKKYQLKFNKIKIIIFFIYFFYSFFSLNVNAYDGEKIIFDKVSNIKFNNINKIKKNFYTPVKNLSINNKFNFFDKDKNIKEKNYNLFNTKNELKDILNISDLYLSNIEKYYRFNLNFFKISLSKFTLNFNDVLLDKVSNFCCGNDKNNINYMCNVSNLNYHENIDYDNVNYNYHKNNDFLLLKYTSNNNCILNFFLNWGKSNIYNVTQHKPITNFNNKIFNIKLEKKINSFLNKIEIYNNNCFIDNIRDIYQFNNFLPYNTLHFSNRETKIVGYIDFNNIKSYLGIDLNCEYHYKSSDSKLDIIKYYNYGIFAKINYILANNQKIESGIRYQILNLNTDGIYNNISKIESYPLFYIRYEYENNILPLLGYINLGLNSRFSNNLEMLNMLNTNIIKKENVLQFSTGTELITYDFKGWITYFINGSTNYINKRNENNKKILENISVILSGGELGINYKIYDNFNIYGTLSGFFGKSLRSNFDRISDISPTENKLGFNIKLKSLKISGIIKTILSYKNCESEYNYIASTNINWKFKKSVNIDIGIDNLFNNNYEQLLILTGYQEFDKEFSPKLIFGKKIWLNLKLNF